MKTRLLILLLLLTSALCAQEKEGEHSSRVDFGVRAGFNSTLLRITDFSVNGTPVNEVQIQNSYKVGYMGSLFMRINLGKAERHFLQPELTYAVNKGSAVFAKPTDGGNESVPDDLPVTEAAISSSMHSIEVPVLYGYHFIKQEPYIMSFFAGPKLRYLLEDKAETTFTNLEANERGEQLNKLNVSLTVGVAVNINRIFFDFRYSMGLHNIERKVSDQISFHRQDNVLSFSLGVLF